MQSFTNFEVLVQDGASSDGTLELLQRDRHLFSYLDSSTDNGVYQAWNRALAHAAGPWICFLGADDRLASPDVLARYAEVLANVPAVYRVVYAQVRLVDSRGRPLGVVGEPWESCRERFRRSDSLPHPALMHHRSLFIEHGRFDEAFTIAGDYEFLLRELKAKDAKFVPGLVAVEMYAGGLSNRLENMPLMLQETKAALARHGLLRSSAAWRRRILKWQLAAWAARLVGPRLVDPLVRVYAGNRR